MSDELTPEQIALNALKPQSASHEGSSASQVPIADQIAADRYRREQAAASSNTLGIRFFNTRPPGTT